MSYTWDHRMLELAAFVARWSKDPSTKVGAVITDEYYRVVSLGFNGLPRGMEDSEEILLDRDQKLLAMIHAEENAMLFATRPLHGCQIFVTPLHPCGPCAAKIRQAGITRVVTRTPSGADDRWWASFQMAQRVFGDDVTVVTW